MTDKEFLHALYVKYYQGKSAVIDMPVVSVDTGKGRCIDCGFKRKLGTRGHAKGRCKKCRKVGSPE